MLSCNQCTKIQLPFSPVLKPLSFNVLPSAKESPHPWLTHRSRLKRRYFVQTSLFPEGGCNTFPAPQPRAALCSSAKAGFKRALIKTSRKINIKTNHKEHLFPACLRINAAFVVLTWLQALCCKRRSQWSWWVPGAAGFLLQGRKSRSARGWGGSGLTPAEPCKELLCHQLSRFQRGISVHSQTPAWDEWIYLFISLAHLVLQGLKKAQNGLEVEFFAYYKPLLCVCFSFIENLQPELFCIPVFFSEAGWGLHLSFSTQGLSLLGKEVPMCTQSC